MTTQSTEPLTKQIITEMRRNWRREVWTEEDVRYWRGILEALIREIGEDRTRRAWDACRKYQKFFPTEAEFREYVPPKERVSETTEQMKEWKEEYERNKQDPEWQKAYAELKSSLKGKFKGVKLEGEWEKSR